MRTTLDLDESLLALAMKESGAPTKTAVIEMALQLLVDQAARRRLARMHGAIPGAKAPRRRRGA